MCLALCTNKLGMLRMMPVLCGSVPTCCWYLDVGNFGYWATLVVAFYQVPGTMVHLRRFITDHIHRIYTLPRHNTSTSIVVLPNSQQHDRHPDVPRRCRYPHRILDCLRRADGRAIRCASASSSLSMQSAGTAYVNTLPGASFPDGKVIKKSSIPV